MAYKFNDEDKEGGDFAERLPFGVNDVVITAVEAGATDDGKEFVKITVENAAGVSEEARVWFTEKSAKYSFATLRQIAVHNADAADKEKARMAIENCVDTEALAKLLTKNCIGGQAWVEKYYDPSRTYEREGQTYRSINTNLRGYEPKLKPELLDDKQTSGNAAVDKAFPGAEKVDASEGIPADDNWGK